MTEPRILIVDNDPEYLKTAREYFELVGYGVAVTGDVNQAKQILNEGHVSLAILDVRLKDENDDKDLTGLSLAKESNPSVPKIVLTKYPSYQVVRDALGPTVDGPPPAIGFIAKQEGLDALNLLVKLALTRFPPLLEKNLLRIFQAPAPVTLRNRLEQIGVEEATDRMLKTYESTAAELTHYRNQETRKASQLHTAGLVARVLGLLLVLASIVLLLSGSTTSGIVSLVAGTVANAIQILFSAREDKAHGRVKNYFEELLDINRIGNVITICEALESSHDRDTYRKKIIDHIITERWIVH